MYEIIKKFCENEKANGLFLMDLPTGFGKTHNVIQYIFDAVCDEKNKEKKFFFITNLKKNLPEKQLRKLFEKSGRKKEFEQKFLYLNSNAELAIEGYKKNLDDKDKPPIKSRVPKDILEWEETKFFFQDLKDIVSQRANKQNGEMTSSSIENTFATKIERDFRHKVEMQLKSEFKKVEDRKKAVLVNERWNWLGDLYESTKTSEKQIIILSAKKFVTKNDTLVEPPYFFYTNKIIENAVVFIDEFDAVKKDFLDNIIDDGIRDKIDFIELFKDIHAVLQVKVFQKALFRKSKWYLGRKYGNKPVESVIEGFKETARQIFDDFSLSCDIRTHREQDLSKNFLFQDSQYHTIASDNRSISVSHYGEEGLNEIHVSSDEGVDGSYGIQRMLSKVRGFVSFFQIGVWRLAYNMFCYRNENRIGDGEFTMEAAVNSILKEFQLKDKHINFLKTQILQDIKKKDNDGLSKDFDLKFYAKGLRYYAFIDEISNDFQSVIMMFSFNNTPERILLNVCERAKVVGISATATIPSAIGNFNLEYLKEQLGENYVKMTRNDRMRLRDEFEAGQKGYNRIAIHAELLGKEIRDCYDDKIWMNIYGDEEVAKEAHNLVCNSVPENDNGFYKERYYRIVFAYKKFFENKDIHSFLCILTTHPKEYCCRYLNQKTLLDLFCFIDRDAIKKVEWLKTENFEEDKNRISASLKSGEKKFVVSAYATLGAGQNLQYKIPPRLLQSLILVNKDRINDDEKDYEKDYDAIYLDNPTNLLVNVNVDNLTQKDFVHFLFQMEYLQANGETSAELTMKHIRKGFEAFSTQHKPILRKVDSLKNRASVKQFATRSVIQAVGRMCRTSHKSPNIYIYADSRIAENLDCSVADELILNKEFKKLLEIVDRKQERDIYRPKLEIKAENDSKALYGFINMMLSDSWSDVKIERWKELREFALRHPTISLEDLNNSKFNSFYAQLPKKSNILYYTQEYNYRNVYISFERDDYHNALVSAEACRLNRLMSHQVIKNYFEENGYATSFEPNDCIMLPAMYNNIYKGALGEVVGRLIFLKLLKVDLEDITDYASFELFDYKVPEKPIYVDFKHWSPCSDVEREYMENKIMEKAHKCGCKKALVVNILLDRSIPTRHIDGDDVEILAVPSLLIDDGELKRDDEAYQMIRRFIAG